jgi:AcrR family transcriptional regulator
VAKTKTKRRDMRTRSGRAEGRDARQELLEAALAVFAERGYRDASVDEIAERAGYSKGAFYWHFSSKDELFWALIEERILKPWQESLRLLESASADEDMAPEANRKFAELLHGQRDLIVVEQDYWSQAVRDSKVRARYVKRRREFRQGYGRAIAARIEKLGGPPLKGDPEQMATVFMVLGEGLTREKLIDSEAVPDNLLGDTFAMFYAGHVAQAGKK